MRATKDLCVIDVAVGKVRAHQDEIARSKATNVVSHVTMSRALGDKREFDFWVIMKRAIEAPVLKSMKREGTLPIMGDFFQDGFHSANLTR